MNKYRNVLFFDLGLSGHHVEYLYHLMKYRMEHPQCSKFVLFTHPGFMDRVAALNLPDGWQQSGITVVHPSAAQMQRLEATQSVVLRAEEEIRMLHNNLEKYSVKCCHLMELNQFQFVLGKAYARRFPCAIRGILFDPYPATDKGGNFTDAYKWRVQRFRKHLQTLWMLRNKKIDHIYVLNDFDATQYLNSRYRKKNFFITLADPILVPPGFNHQVADAKPKSSSRCRFLLFGSLSSKKGIFQVIDALRCLPETIAEKIEIIFAGKVIKAERDHFRLAIAAVQRDRPNIRITFHDEFIPYEKIPVLFSESDCILLPYTITGFSSGVIGHSALYGKPVIGSAKGLIGKQIKSYKLGMGIENVNGSNIAAALIDFVTKGPSIIDNAGMRRFVEEHRPNKFVETLLERCA